MLTVSIGIATKHHLSTLTTHLHRLCPLTQFILILTIGKIHTFKASIQALVILLIDAVARLFQQLFSNKLSPITKDSQLGALWMLVVQARITCLQTTTVADHMLCQDNLCTLYQCYKELVKQFKRLNKHNKPFSVTWIQDIELAIPVLSTQHHHIIWMLAHLISKMSGSNLPHSTAQMLQHKTDHVTQK